MIIVWVFLWWMLFSGTSEVGEYRTSFPVDREHIVRGALRGCHSAEREEQQHSAVTVICLELSFCCGLG